MKTWVPSREEGLRRLERFLPFAGRSYAKLRNYDLGPGEHRHVSTLSPWIRHRIILEDEVVSAVLERHSFSAAEKFIQEIFWRTYWKGWLELRPGVWKDYRERITALVAELEHNGDLRSRWEEATASRTGIECFDAWSGELIQTGYLHNHARMWFASIWIFTLELPWELGADFFLRHLLDGDPASNTLSWRWVAGLQTRDKTYLARPENIARYTEGRFHPVSQLSTTARPLAGAIPPPPIAPPRCVSWDRALPTGLLLTEEDLHPDFLLNEGPPFRGAVFFQATEQRSPLDLSPNVLHFVQGALAYTRDRLEVQLQLMNEPVHGADATNSIVDWSMRLGLRQIVTPYVPVGPTAEALDPLSERLSEHGVALITALRRWDQLAWPHATRGFFQFREKIPKVLSDIGKKMSPAA